MEQENKITCLQELIDWIDDSKICFVSEQEDDYFRIEAPNNANVYISIEKDDDTCDIIERTIEYLRNFDADETFMELWSVGFAKHNSFSPSQFIKMLQEDEETFSTLAWQLKNHIKPLHYSKAI